MADPPRWLSRPLWPHFLGAAFLIVLIALVVIGIMVSAGHGGVA